MNSKSPGTQQKCELSLRFLPRSMANSMKFQNRRRMDPTAEGLVQAVLPTQERRVREEDDRAAAQCSPGPREFHHKNLAATAVGEKLAQAQLD
jgi:hypothetical protein